MGEIHAVSRTPKLVCLLGVRRSGGLIFGSWARGLARVYAVDDGASIIEAIEALD